MTLDAKCSDALGHVHESRLRLLLHVLELTATKIQEPLKSQKGFQEPERLSRAGMAFKSKILKSLEILKDI